MIDLQHYSQAFWHRLKYFVSRYNSDHCSTNAAALTYMTLFALVPLLTVLYAMAAAFQDAEAQIQGFLFRHLVPETSSSIQQYLNEFSRHAKSLTGPGIAFVLITAVLMLRNIEKAFNRIWRARQHRSPIASFMLYWAVLTLIPITIGLALGMSTYFAAVTDTLQHYQLDGTRALLLQSAPLLLSTAGFSLVYLAVPNCQVPLKHAVIGGLLAAIAFHLARSVFAALVVRSSLSSIYGAFAAVPIFVFWIYLSWNIVLMGGILVHSLSAYQTRAQARRPTVLKALDVLYLLWQRQQLGMTISERELLTGKRSGVRGLDSETWSSLRDLFLRHKLITQNDSGHYLLCRDLHSVQLWQLREWLLDERALNDAELPGELGWQHRVSRLLSAQRDSGREILDCNLVELFSQ